MNIEIRSAEEMHASAIEQLSEVLGYTIAREQVKRNLVSLENSDQKVLVAVTKSEVVGYCHAGITYWLMMAPMVEIFAMVVSPDFRGKGIGKLFINQVEEFAKESGLKEVWIRSNVQRKDSHPFFIHHGYSKIKNQGVYVREL